MENDQQIFDCYYIMRMFLIDNNDWHVRCYHITCAEHTRRSKRIAKWFEYKLATRGQDLIAEKLKGNNEYVWGWRGGERVPISDS